MAVGFKRHELQRRYDVVSVTEDNWHAYTGEKTAEIVSGHLRCLNPRSTALLNAGAGVYRVVLGAWREIPLDLFLKPLRRRPRAVCASVERLPFKSSAIGAVVCVGEVLSYCDPAAAIREFARVLEPDGLLICDFASSRSPRYWFRPTYGRAADLISDIYNGSPERTWVYDPKYIEALLRSAQFRIKKVTGTHSWSALLRRVGMSPESAVRAQKTLDSLKLPARISDLTTIVASRSSYAT